MHGNPEAPATHEADPRPPESLLARSTGRIVPCAFEPHPWLRSPHAQTIFASQFRPSPPVSVDRERVELPDGDFVDVFWKRTERLTGPIVVVLHGLTGSIVSKYARGLLGTLAARGFRPVLFQFRGAGEEPNRLARSYHSGDTGDLAYFVERIRAREPGVPIAVVGYSLGGNVLLKWLGELGAASPLAVAVAVSVPFDLGACAEAIQRGFSRIYQRRLVRNMRRSAERKFRLTPPGFEHPPLHRLRTFFEFDDAITAPLNNFRSVAHYYASSSSRRFLSSIETPTLVIQSLDDPLLAPTIVPREHDLPPRVTVELSERGGHVGFIAAGRRRRPRYWLEDRIPAFLADALAVEAVA